MQPQGQHVQLRHGQQPRLVGRAGAPRPAQRPLGRGDVRAAAEVRERPAVRGEHRLGRRHGAFPAADQEAPAGQAGARHAAGPADVVPDVDGQRVVGAQRALMGAQRGAGASRTAVGEPRAARTLRRAGAGAGGTCSGMVGRLSLGDTVERAGADDAVSVRGQSMADRGCGPARSVAVPQLPVRTPGRWAPTLCLVSGVYTTYVLKVFRLPALWISGKAESGPLCEVFSAALRDGFTAPPRISSASAVGRISSVFLIKEMRSADRREICPRDVPVRWRHFEPIGTGTPARRYRSDCRGIIDRSACPGGVGDGPNGPWPRAVHSRRDPSMGEKVAADGFDLAGPGALSKKASRVSGGAGRGS